MQQWSTNSVSSTGECFFYLWNFFRNHRKTHSRTQSPMERYNIPSRHVHSRLKRRFVKNFIFNLLPRELRNGASEHWLYFPEKLHPFSHMPGKCFLATLMRKRMKTQVFLGSICNDLCCARAWKWRKRAPCDGRNSFDGHITWGKWRIRDKHRIEKCHGECRTFGTSRLKPIESGGYASNIQRGCGIVSLVSHVLWKNFLPLERRTCKYSGVQCKAPVGVISGTDVSSKNRMRFIVFGAVFLSDFETSIFPT